MHEVQADVEEFHRVVCGMEPTREIAIRRPELRAALLAEETRETLEAITGVRWWVTPADAYWRAPSAKERTGDVLVPGGADLLEALDGLCDVLCVTYGTAAEWGVDLAPFWREVHRSNMAKEGGSMRGDGKRLKPDGWVPPDLRRILEEQRGR